MIEATTQAHIAQAMKTAHIERAKAWSDFWKMMWQLPKFELRRKSSRWA